MGDDGDAETNQPTKPTPISIYLSSTRTPPYLTLPKSIDTPEGVEMLGLHRSNHQKRKEQRSETKQADIYSTNKVMMMISMRATVVALLVAGMAGYSSGSYCVCQDSVSDQNLLQANIDYACGPGSANCTAINPGGACYQPGDLKAHCDYAVNYYYQLQGQVNGSCDFSGTAVVTNTVPAADVASSGCSYPASPSQVLNGGAVATTPAAATTPSTTTSSSPTTTTTTGSPTYGVPIAPTAYDNTFSTNAAAFNHSFSLPLVILLLFLSNYYFLLRA